MISRRGFLSGVGSGLAIGFTLSCGDEKKKPTAPAKSGAQGKKAEAKEKREPAMAGKGGAQLNAWIHISEDDIVTLRIPESEMGQGILTGLSMILAEHLEAEMSQVRAEHAPANAQLYGRQSTGGSTSVRMGYEGLAKAAATARDLLRMAAASAWKVETEDVVASKGVLRRKDGKGEAKFGEFVSRAAKFELAKGYEPKVKDWKAHSIIGTDAKRLDTWDKVHGTAVYGLDVRMEGMHTAKIVRSPSVGGKLRSFDGAKAKAMAGIADVFEVPSGVAVVGEHYWAATKGAKAVTAKWEEPNRKLDDKSIKQSLRASLPKGKEARKEGTPSFSGAKNELEAEYFVPYLAHAPMEPLSCTARVSADACELWVSTQSPTNVQRTAAQITGLSPDKVTVHTMMLGGGFGRRSNTDYVAEAVHVAKKLGKPVKVVWDREDGIRGYQYRPVALNRMRGAVDENGMPTMWDHEIASPSIVKRFGPIRGGIDGTSVEGAKNLPYAIPNLRVTYADVDLPVDLWFWRSVGSSQNAYVTECFFDELCRLGKKDPVEARLALLKDKPRHAKLVSAAAEAAGWGKSPGQGKALGIAVHESFGSIVAEVATVSVEGKQVVVHDVVCAVDCGQVINPDTIRAQMDSGVVYGLSAALYGDISFKEGRVVQGNFDTYQVLRMREMPKIKTIIKTSGDALGGIGEPATPPIAPAVVNALFALRGKPIRSLPIRLEETT